MRIGIGLAAALAVLSSSGHANAAAAAASAWKTEDAKDSVTDQRSFLVSLAGEGGTFQVGCSNAAAGKLSVYLLAPRGVFFGQGLRNLTYRVDDAPATTEQWFYGDDIATSASVSDGPARVGALVDAVIKGQRLILRSMDYRGNQRDAAFALPTDHGAIDRARSVCLGGNAR